MKLRLPGPSSLNFLAGIFAGAGINLLTSVATGPEGTVSTGKVAVDSLCWVAAAGFLTWAAQLVEHGERDADLYIDREFSDEEKREIREQYIGAAMRKAWAPLIGTLVAFVLALLLLPGLIHWAELF
ncbi:hypothetical protein [Dactylosporangium sp. CS-033363]|uniref:hypothetical protein n=1 Tax=unclassified Dactylosporangium TaxID=2621675 RepID=UPI003D8C57F9